jgi:hypothetical protein
MIVDGETKSTYPLVVVLGASSLPWLARVVMQMICPQGTINQAMQYGMLSGFRVVFLFYAADTLLAVELPVN